MLYFIEFKNQAVKQLQVLTPTIQSRIVKKLNWLAENFEQIIPNPLMANLAGFYKLRIGDYRVIYTFNSEQKIITIHEIGHRRDIYD